MESLLASPVSAHAPPGDSEFPTCRSGDQRASLLGARIVACRASSKLRLGFARFELRLNSWALLPALPPVRLIPDNNIRRLLFVEWRKWGSCDGDVLLLQQ
jgi:hypothetical protein